MTNNIKISIVTATMNSVETIAECLASVAIQSHLNREHIIIDGGSSDGTQNIIKFHAENIAVFISERDRGIYDALNKGIHRSTGAVVGFLHADDLYASKYVLEKVARIFEDPSVCAVYGDLDYVSQQNTANVVRRWRSREFNKKDLSYGWMPAHPTLYIRREWYEVIGGFNINYTIAADYLSILQLFTQPKFKAVYLPEVLVKMRLGGISNRSFFMVIKKTKEDWIALRSCGFSLFRATFAIVWKNLRKLPQFI